MKKGEWTFLSNHGRVLAFISKHPDNTSLNIAYEASLSVGGVQRIITDLEEAGYLERIKVGRRNSYIVHPELPMRHRLESHHSVGDLLAALGCWPEKQYTGLVQHAHKEPAHSISR
jgi:hypothetical protein